MFLFPIHYLHIDVYCLLPALLIVFVNGSRCKHHLTVSINKAIIGVRRLSRAEIWVFEYLHCGFCVLFFLKPPGFAFNFLVRYGCRPSSSRLWLVPSRSVRWLSTHRARNTRTGKLEMRAPYTAKTLLLLLSDNGVGEVY